MLRTLAIRLSVEHKRCKRAFRVETVVNDQFSVRAVAYNNTREAVVGFDMISHTIYIFINKNEEGNDNDNNKS